jgi:WXG100 family type VII secretion target
LEKAVTSPNTGRAQGDTAVLMNAAQMTDQVASHMQQYAGSMNSKLQPLAQAWIGQSSTAFQSFQSDYQTSMTQLTQKLTELAAQIRRTAQAHETADQDSNRQLANASSGQSGSSGSALSTSLNT